MKTHSVAAKTWQKQLMTNLQVDPSFHRLLIGLAWENSRHSATTQLGFPRDDVWGTSAKTPHWWRVTTQIWVVLLIGWSKSSTNHFAENPIVASRKVSCNFSRNVRTDKCYWVNTIPSLKGVAALLKVRINDWLTAAWINFNYPL